MVCWLEFQNLRSKRKENVSVPGNPHPNPKYQFKPGNPGGPGRPKGRTITGTLRDMLDADKLGGKPIGEGKKVMDLLCEVILREALKGDVQFVKLAVERVEYSNIQELQERVERLVAARSGSNGQAGHDGGGGPPDNGAGPKP